MHTADDKSTITSLKTYVKTTAAYSATKDSRLSFSKGDVIEVINITGSWHVGRLVKARSHPITGEPKKYPPNFVKNVNYTP